jgi:ribosomal protein L14
MRRKFTDEEAWPDRYGMIVPPQYLQLAHDTQGDRIIVVVQKSRSMGDGGPGSTSAAAANKVRRGDIRHAIIVRTVKKVQRKDGMVVKFDDNACALIGKNGEPLGTRINGESGYEVRRNTLGRLQYRQVWWVQSSGTSSSRRYYR